MRQRTHEEAADGLHFDCSPSAASLCWFASNFPIRFFTALAYAEVGVFLGGDADSLGEGFEEVAVVSEAAALVGFVDAGSFIEQ